MEKAVDRNRTSSFQGMRVIAILFIVLLHAGKSIGEIGCLISFFFVLSGFLYHDHSDNKEYIIYSLKKVFPIYWLTFTIDFIVQHRCLSWCVLPHLFLIQTYWPMPEPLGDGLVKPYYYEYLGVSWFLSCLLFCYLLAPLFSRLILKIMRDTFLFLLIILFFLSFYLNLNIPPEYQKWAWYVSPYYRCIEYVSGMFLSRILVDVPADNIETFSKVEEYESRYHIWGRDYVLPSLCMAIYYGSFFLLNTRLWVLPNLFIIYYIYKYNPFVIHLLFGNRFLVRCATVILPVYLLHNSIIPIVRDLGGGWIYCTIISITIGVIYALLWKYFTLLIKNKRKEHC